MSTEASMAAAWPATPRIGSNGTLQLTVFYLWRSPVFQMQKVLGHSTLEMTRRYAKLVTADLQAVHERVSALSNSRLFDHRPIRHARTHHDDSTGCGTGVSGKRISLADCGPASPEQPRRLP